MVVSQATTPPPNLQGASILQYGAIIYYKAGFKIIKAGFHFYSFLM